MSTAQKLDISIHALHEESDAAHVDLRRIAVISIHALHEESDFMVDHTIRHQDHFNPRSP